MGHEQLKQIINKIADVGIEAVYAVSSMGLPVMETKTPSITAAHIQPASAVQIEIMTQLGKKFGLPPNIPPESRPEQQGCATYMWPKTNRIDDLVLFLANAGYFSTAKPTQMERDIFFSSSDGQSVLTRFFAQDGNRTVTIPCKAAQTKESVASQVSKVEPPPTPVPSRPTPGPFPSPTPNSEWKRNLDQKTLNEVLEPILQMYGKYAGIDYKTLYGWPLVVGRNVIYSGEQSNRIFSSNPGRLTIHDLGWDSQYLPFMMHEIPHADRKGPFKLEIALMQETNRRMRDSLPLPTKTGTIFGFEVSGPYGQVSENQFTSYSNRMEEAFAEAVRIEIYGQNGIVVTTPNGYGLMGEYLLWINTKHNISMFKFNKVCLSAGNFVFQTIPEYS